MMLPVDSLTGLCIKYFRITVSLVFVEATDCSTDIKRREANIYVHTAAVCGLDNFKFHFL